MKLNVMMEGRGREKGALTSDDIKPHMRLRATLLVQDRGPV